MYTLCTTLDNVKLAAQELANSEYIILDCEGLELGTEIGALSLLCLSGPEAATVYIFDVLSLPKEALQLLFSDVLGTVGSDDTKQKIKVVWDGRMDFSELFFNHKYELSPTLDLQLVDILSREIRREGDHSRLQRICRRDFPWSIVSKLQLEGVHRLTSLDRALYEHSVLSVPPKNDVVKRMHRNGNSDFWMKRPLKPVLLEYAADDIKRIAALYRRFLALDYLHLSRLSEALELSNRYDSECRLYGRPDIQQDSYRFRHHPYLPLDALGKPISLEIASQCTGCQRILANTHFPYNATHSEVQGGKYVGPGSESRSSLCKICTLIVAKDQSS